MQNWLWTWTTATRTVPPCAYSVVVTVSYIQHVFSYTAVNSSAWSWLDILEDRGAHVDECVRHDWLIWTGEEIWKGHLRGERIGEKGSQFLDRSTSPALSWHHLFDALLSLRYSLLSSLSVLRSASCIALAHAGSQHQGALLRDFWVFDHALPHLLLLPVWVHPFHISPIALTLRGETNTKIY